MALRMLIINQAVKAEIVAAIERARANPLPLAETMKIAILDDRTELKLADRKGRPQRFNSQGLLLPGGFQVSFSFEEQPAGIVRHLSVSVDTPGKFPQPAAVEMIAKEFGFSGFPPDGGKVWMEEFRPGHYCINVAELAHPSALPKTKQ